MLPGLALTAAILSSGSRPIPVQVNTSVELLSIVFRLAGAGEYMMTSDEIPYAKRVDAYFGKFKSHPLIEYAKRVREDNGIGFNAVADFAVHVEPGKAKFRFSGTYLHTRLDERWQGDSAERFLALLGQFMRDTKSNEFFKSEQKFYRQAEGRLSDLLKKQPYAEWFASTFGETKGMTFSAIPGLLNGGANYGQSVLYPDGRYAIMPVIGVSQFDKEGLPIFTDGHAGTVVHEFAHTFTNQLIDKYWPEIESSFATIFPTRADVLRPQAYNSAKATAYESMVRAVTVLYAREHYSPAVAEEAATEELRRGFLWTKELTDVFERFRKTHPGELFAGAMPDVVKFFKALAPTMPERIQMLPKIVRVSIKADSEVEAGEGVLEVVFDRNMDTSRKGVSGIPVASWPDGSKGAKWAEDGLSVRIPYKLEAGQEYTLTIGNVYYPSYQSADGWPLDPVGIYFKTKP